MRVPDCRAPTALRKQAAGRPAGFLALQECPTWEALPASGLSLAPARSLTWVLVESSHIYSNVKPQF